MKTSVSVGPNAVVGYSSSLLLKQ